MKFTIEITLGNDAMRLGDDVATALEGVARHLRTFPGDHELSGIHDYREAHSIRDTNGNRVGVWHVVEGKVTL